jgi:aminoglycoside phosphotransferase (APT) family kinase protein
MDVLDIERADGSRCKVSLRRFVAGHEGHEASTPEEVRREFEILRLVESAGIPAPRPILLDAEGEYFGVPAIVMSYLPGRPVSHDEH